MKRVLGASLFAATFAFAGVALAQPGGGFGGPGGGGPPGGNMGFLLRNEQIQEELKLDDATADEVQSIVEEQGEAIREMFRSGEFDFRSEEGREKMREAMQEQSAKLETELGSVLKPEQLSRLKQISRQMQTRRPGQGTGLVDNEELVKELGLKESQLSQMREMAPKVQEELRADIQAAQKKAEEKLLAVLTPEQKAKYAELMGEPFQFDPSRGGFGQGGPGGGRGPGGPGGPGGRGPGGPGGGRGQGGGGNRDNEPLPEL